MQWTFEEDVKFDYFKVTFKFSSTILIIIHTGNNIHQSCDNHGLPLITPLKLKRLSKARDYTKYSFLPQTITQWNNLPAEVAAAPTLEAFKSGVCTLTH